MRDLERQPLLTTVVGSYPTDGLPPRRAISRAVEDQIAAGVDLISDGQVRGDMIGAFAARIPGFRQAPDGVWEVEDALDLPDGPITVADVVFARELAQGRAEVKGIVTGPITLALSCRVAPNAPYYGPTDASLLLRLAEILGHEVAALVASGAQVVQVDEPLLPAALAGPIGEELAYDALRELANSPRIPALHVCGDISAVTSHLLLLPFAVLDIENAATANLPSFDPDELEYATATLSVGVVSTADAAVESAQTIDERIAAATRLVPPDRLWISPDCGLRTLTRDAAREKLHRMVAATQDARARL